MHACVRPCVRVCVCVCVCVDRCVELVTLMELCVRHPLSLHLQWSVFVET